MIWTARGALALLMMGSSLLFVWQTWADAWQLEDMVAAAARQMAESTCRCQAEGLRACANANEALVPRAAAALWPAVQRRALVYLTAWTELYGETWYWATAPFRAAMECSGARRDWLVPLWATIGVAMSLSSSLLSLIAEPWRARRRRLEYEAAVRAAHEE